MGILSRFAIPAIVFILTLAFGFFLTRLGRPYHRLLFNVHKLAALAAVVVTVIQLVRVFRGVDLAALPIVLLVAAALSSVALFVSGALMSAGTLDYGLLRTVHRVALAALVIAMPVAVVLLGTRG